MAFSLEAFEGIKSLTTPFIQPILLPFLYYFLQSLGSILSLWKKGERIQDEADSINSQPSVPYDFIVGIAKWFNCHFKIKFYQAFFENPLIFSLIYL